MPTNSSRPSVVERGLVLQGDQIRHGGVSSIQPDYGNVYPAASPTRHSDRTAIDMSLSDNVNKSLGLNSQTECGITLR